jgi:predicted Ser/Thr protein kinase
MPSSFHFKLEVLSMSVPDDNNSESDIRLRVGDQIKYLTVAPGTFPVDIISWPPDLFENLPKLPSGDWTRAHICRKSGHLVVEPSNKPLKGVTTSWHHNLVDVQSIALEERLSARVEVVKYNSKSVVSKIARFEFEVPWMETETAIYQAIDGHGIGPAFLGHLVEHGRVMGFLIEKIDGRNGEIDDLEACESIVKRLHSLGIVHGDLNKYNFIIGPTRTTLIDFEGAIKNRNKEAMQKELLRLTEELTEKTGRGCPYRPCTP